MSNLSREEVAERVLSAYAAVARWGARDFKRGHLAPDLTPTQLAILRWSGRVPDITTSHLAERLDLSVPTVVRALDALERKGFVIRRRSARDRREVEIEVTAAGAEARATLERARLERLMHLLNGMTEEEITGLLVGYEGMARAAAQAGERLEAG